MVYGSSLENIHFSSCGRFLVGHHEVFEAPRVIDIARHLKHAKPMPPMDIIDLSNEIKQDKRVAVLKSNSQTARAIHSTSNLTMHAPNGVPEFRTLRSYADGAIVRKRLNPHMEVDETLLYLPRGCGENTSVSVLDDPDTESERIRIVLTNSSQDSYSWNDPTNKLPSIVKRPERNIREYKVPSSAIVSSNVFRGECC
jgi:hypothetical protein